ncbi:hypothetical protein NQ314_015899 [Rhamnusium bicolor]|uniref:Uncharacterized protein n=1 Tax=Rhamnusium bicolor TaxID=1586634 RepID=A0AAV8WYE2_9CUCU|nr:hypothetical protein NQ314_015899 [Rhamnusium bicolor]
MQIATLLKKKLSRIQVEPGKNCGTKYENGLFFTDEEGNVHEIYIEEEEQTFVKIFDFPIELDNNKIKEKLSRYDTVKSIRNDKWSSEGMYNFESGVRLVTMSIKQNVPSYLTIEGRTSLITYPNQIRTCMFSEEAGHVRRDCPKKGD